jgi:hypothetical protein
MDCRVTIDNYSDFLPLLQDALTNAEKINLLVDHEGLSRFEGRLKSLMHKGMDVTLELENGTKLSLKHVVAVNGLFVSHYSEC